MRIWIINHYATPKHGSSGSRHASLAEILTQRGHDITIFAASVRHIGGAESGAIEIPRGRLFIDKDYANVKWRFIRVPSYRNSMQRFINMNAFGKNLCRAFHDLPRPDIIIGSTIHPYAVNAAIFLAAHHKVPFVYEIRDIWPDSLVDLNSLSRWNPVYWHLRYLERKAFNRATGVIVLFPGMYSYLERHRFPLNRACLLPNGIDACSYPPLAPAKGQYPFVISYFGSHGTANGLDTMIDAALLLKQRNHERDIMFRCVGEGTQKALLYERVRSLGLKNITFFPAVSKPKLIPLAEESDAFLFTLRRMPVLQRYGISPNKLYEYFMWERPVIFSCESQNDPVRDFNAGLSITPEDAESLANAALTLRAHSPQVRREMGRRGRRFAETNHDFRRLANTLDAFLQKISISFSRGEASCRAA